MTSRINKHFLDHKHNARKRGVKFHFSFDLWLDTWKQSGKLSKRGPRKHQYVMARIGDRGAYEIGNVKIITASQNVKEKKIGAKTRAILRANALGHPVSQRVRKILSKARKGKKLSEAHRKKVALVWLGRKHTLATRKKMSHAATGRKLSVATRKRMSHGAKLRWKLQRAKNA